MNPDAVEIPGNQVDENCDGLVELLGGTTVTTHDTGLGLDTGSESGKYGCNCDTSGLPVGGVWVLLLGLLVRRRRV